MYKHTAEACIPVPHPERVAKKLCARSADYCRSIDDMGADKLLDFGDARALLRLTDDGLRLQVDAQDTITFYGIRTLLLGILCAVAKFSGEHAEWHSAGSEPVGSM
ncbi:SMa0974 family conjugal transfer regulator [Ensifer sp. MJa1]|uniref:SMa0974 family conjugal transfer regulator n=1 Tax=Ensifer sp. MJa1 TaxID=2919888 RepID=UPI00300859CE